MFKRERSKRVPILGIEGVGKTSLLFTLIQYLSVNGFGRLGDDPDSIIPAALQYVQRGEPIPATVKRSQLGITITRIPNAPRLEAQIHVELSCDDIAGRDFRALLEIVRNNPNCSAGTDAPRELLLFRELLGACSGMLIVVDLLRDLTADEFNSNLTRNLNSALGDQVGSMMTAISLAARFNRGKLANMPVYFVFTKGDKHGVTNDRIDSYFRHAGAICLEQLRGLGASVQSYHVQAAEWSMESDLTGLGFEKLVSDLMVTLKGNAP